MHEFSIATQIVESVREVSDSFRSGQAMKVCVQIGELTGLRAEEIQFHFNSLTRETVMACAILEIEPVDAHIRCPQCAFTGRPGPGPNQSAMTRAAILSCPRCGHESELVRGEECKLKSVIQMDAEPIQVPNQPGTKLLYERSNH